MRLAVVFSLLFLSGCNWWDDSPVPSPNYTAEFALNGPVPTLTACQGVREVAYHVAKCFKNGIETSLESCQGLDKPPLQVKSPSGTVTDELYNYKDEVIGYNIFNCNQGEVKLENPADVSCTDSRYIRQNNNGHLECNPYIIDLDHMLTSEHRVTSQYNNSIEYKSTVNLEIPGYNKDKIWNPETNLFYNNSEGTLELDDNYNDYELLDWNRFCALYTNGNHYCINNLAGVPNGSREELVTDADKIYFNYYECSKKGIEYYCRNGYYIFKVLEMEGVEEFYSLPYHICFYKNNELWCAGKFKNTDENTIGLENGPVYTKISDEKPLKIDSGTSSICLIKSDNYLYCIGDVSQGYSGMPLGLVTNELVKNEAWPKLKNFIMTGSRFIGVGLDNQLYQTNINNLYYFLEESNQVIPGYIRSNKISN